MSQRKRKPRGLSGKAKKAIVNARIEQAVKGAMCARAKRAGMTSSEFVRAAITKAATLPDDRFESFVNEALYGELAPLAQHYKQELKVQRLCFKAVGILQAISAGKTLEGLHPFGDDIQEVAVFFAELASEYQ
jgi:antitoxin component of RelBE/YafQ-DinJ toxin-antitoxin module